MSKRMSKKDKAMQRKRRILFAFMPLILGWVSYSIYVNVHDLVQTVSFINKASFTEALVIDVREGIHDELIHIHPSGHIALEGDSYYKPIILVETSQIPLLVRELTDISEHDYQIQQTLPIAIFQEGDSITIREHHEHFLWGGLVVKLGLNIFKLLFLLWIWKKLHQRWSKKKPKKKSTASKRKPRAKKKTQEKTPPSPPSEEPAVAGDPEPH